MSVQLSVDIRAARADVVESTVGTSPILKLRSGAKPANCAAGDSGTVISTITLPSDWLTNPGTGVKAKSGTWQDTTADNAGTIAHFRLYDSGGSTCKMQGDVTITGGGGDLTVDNDDVEAGQQITITAFGWTEPNS
jgi:hypothetical protein